HRAAERHGQPMTPGTLPVLEAEALRELDAFFATHRLARFVHFNMNGSQFGFEALNQRHRTLPGSHLKLPSPCACFDLAGYLKRRLGRSFIAHPYLHSLIRLNGLESPNYLSPDRADEAGECGQWEDLTLSLEAKVSAIEQLYRLLWDGELRT